MLEFLAEHNGRALIEAETGVGKTAVGGALLRACHKQGVTPTMYVTTNKALVNQVHEDFPEFRKILGRNEHPCLYYEQDKDSLTPERLVELTEDPRSIKADQIPCSFLQECPHRVHQATGETHEKGACRCPYLQQKFEAKQGDKPVLCTAAFYLYARMLSGDFPKVEAVVLDEVHRLPEVVRNCLTYDISDYHLEQSVALVREVDEEMARLLDNFRETMITIIKRKPKDGSRLLTAEEITELMRELDKIDASALAKAIQQAIRKRIIDPAKHRTMLTRLERIVRDLGRYMHSFEFSLPNINRHALNYTCAYTEEEREGKKVHYRLVVRAYYVNPLIRQRLLARRVLAMSATIGDPDIFFYESGMKLPFLQVSSPFSSGNTRIYLPTDTANLAYGERGARDLPQTLRRIARACVLLARKGHRSLVVVVSNDERQRFLRMAIEERLNAISYGDGVTPRQAAERFRDGESHTLVGTATNYAEGIDLPRQVAPVIFILRPGYPNPHDPETQFEERRYGGQVWGIRNWRVMQQAMQVRGRNIRVATDIGVAIFISQQFRKFLFAALPERLQESYRGTLSWDKMMRDVSSFLGGQ